jgi:hypothetical protein
MWASMDHKNWKSLNIGKLHNPAEAHNELEFILNGHDGLLSLKMFL